MASLSLSAFTGYIALLIALCNGFIYFLFLFIRKSKYRKQKLSVAKLARSWMKTHRPLGFICAIFVILHITFVLLSGTFALSPKEVSGILAATLFVLLILSGWLRHRKATGRRKRNHRSIAFLFLFFVLLHIIV
ncbi:hypothetical protein ACERII_00890 [Evansella sp. AB-rgal1]|uniref:hypothetical protein n=1 Tax=Evansella sp. AB-rgal1 TaxID=3242696 RepID=UPI00359CCD0B